MFYLYLYFIHFYTVNALADQLIWYFLIPTWGLKQLMNVIQLFVSCLDVNHYESIYDLPNKSK